MEDYFFDINYSFNSCLESIEAQDYIKNVQAKISTQDIDDDSLIESVGEINFEIYNLNQAKEDGFDIYEILDFTEYSFRHAQSLFDFKNEDFKQAIYKYFDFEIFNQNYCLIHTAWIRPKYRGLGIGPNLFKNIVLNFKSECDLFFLQPYPLQFDLTIDNTLKQEIELNKFELNEAKAIKKLSAYYLNWGFEQINGIKDLMVFNAICPNKKFKNIKLK